MDIDRIQKQALFTYESITTAYHEAGHAVYALLSYMLVLKVMIRKKRERMTGITYYSSLSDSLKSNPSKRLKQKIIDSEICVKYAGPVAELYQYEFSTGLVNYPSLLNDGSYNDMEDAERWIVDFNLAKTSKEKNAVKEKYIAKTKISVVKYWEDITLVAKLLLKNKSIKYEDIKYEIVSKSSKKKFWKSHFKKIDYIYNKIKDFLSQTELSSIIC